MSPPLHAVILAGGEGTRFWPLSRKATPKQFQRVLGNGSLLQHTVERIAPLVPRENTYVVTLADHYHQVLSHLPDLPPENVLGEPCGRNTAPAIALAALHLEERGAGGVMMVLAADHQIDDPERFRNDLSAAVECAGKSDLLITLGIRPRAPETGYGYIKQGAPLQETPAEPLHAVAQFVEKPDRARAQAYLDQGGYLWNSGIFVWNLAAILKAYESFLPQILRELREIRSLPQTPEGQKRRAQSYAGLPSQSVDYGILEKSDRVAVLPCGFYWSDLGSWNALYGELSKDEQGNAVRGRHQGIETQGCLIHSARRLVATVGLRDLVIVDTEDALLICPRERDQDLKKLVQQLRAGGEESVL